jgi:hypothetical protein
MRIMFYPAGLRIMLFEFFLRNAYNGTLLIKKYTATTRGALVKCQDIGSLHATLLVASS